MNIVHFNLILIFATLYLAIFLYIVTNNSLINLCEIEKCPYCYGTDFCGEFKQDKLKFRDSSAFDLFMNYFSVKNVFYAVYNNKSVILKKLAHNFELKHFDNQICNKFNLNNDCDLIKLIEEQSNEIEKKFNFTLRNTSGLNFRVCSRGRIFYQSILNHYLYRSAPYIPLDTYARHIWTILELNVEPLLIQLVKYEDYWPVPQYLGACGRLIVENDCGANLNYFANADWSIRAKITLQILQAVQNFTGRHDFYRFYLTDISPDNIAVDEDLRVTFVDLENVILTDSNWSGENIYHSIDIEDEENFGFFEEKVCVSTLSDHNYYGVCKVLLSKNAPWPMMTGGLLHTPPKDVTESFPELFELIEICVRHSEHMDRFQAVDKIINTLEKILFTSGN